MINNSDLEIKRHLKRKGRHQGVSLADQKRLKERRERAMNLRIAGATLQDIVKANIGYNNVSMVSHDLKKALKSFYIHDVEMLLLTDLAVIDEMQKWCMASLRQGNTSEARNIMALMQFRRETLGVTPEGIQERSQEAARITNNGIMVVQGNTQEYLAAMMEAAGASPEEMQNEFKAIEKVQNSPINAHANAGAPAQTQTRSDVRVIQGELITPETGTGSENKKPGKKLKVRLKKSQTAQQPDQTDASATPGSSRPARASHTRSNASGASVDAHDQSILLEERVELLAQVMEEEQEIRTTPRLGNLADPAVVPAGLTVPNSKLLEVPIKLNDVNQPVSPGVVYRNPPRKLTREESTREVTRKLKKPSTVDRVRTRVLEEEI